MKFLPHKPREQQSVEHRTEIPKQKVRQRRALTLNPLTIVIHVLKVKAKAILNRLFNKTLFKVHVDQELLEQIKTIRQYGRVTLDQDVPGQVSSETQRIVGKTTKDKPTQFSKRAELTVEDLIMAVEVYKQNVPPKHQILSQFSIKPIYTSLGPAYPSRDGTAAWIVNSTGIYLVTNLDLRPKTMKQIIKPRTATEPVERSPSGQRTEKLKEQIEKQSDTFNELPDVTYFDESGTDIFNDGESDMIIDRPTITTSDVIEAFYNYSGTLDDFMKELMQFLRQNDITDSYDSVRDAFNQLQIVVGNKTHGVSVGSSKQLMDYICYINVDWKKALMWMLLLNFNQDIDIMRLLLQFTIKPIEEAINWIFDLFRSINIFGLRPFWWLPIIQWYEDIVYWFALNEYQLMCTFMRFRANMRIGTDIGGKEFLIQVVKNGKLRFTDVGWMDYNQRRVLAMLQMGYNWQCSKIGTVFSVSQIRQIVGNILDTTVDMYNTPNMPIND